MTTHEAMHLFLCKYVHVVDRDDAEVALRLLLEMAAGRREILNELVRGTANDTEPAPAPDGCELV